MAASDNNEQLTSKPFDLFGVALTVTVTFLVTWALNTAITYLQSDSGTISLSQPLAAEGNAFRVMTIENYSARFLEGLAIEVPIAVSTKTLTADPPVIIVDADSKQVGSLKVMRIGELAPRRITRIVLPMPASVGPFHIRILNAEALGLITLSDDGLRSPFITAMMKSLVVAGLTALIALGVVLLGLRAMRTFEARLVKSRAALRADLDKTKTSLQATHERVTEIEAKHDREYKRWRSMATKQRILLQARMLDYAKELSFWRNAIKALLLNKGAKESNVEDLIAQVTRVLGTHGAVTHPNGFEEVRVAAAWLIEHERE